LAAVAGETSSARKTSSLSRPEAVAAANDGAGQLPTMEHPIDRECVHFQKLSYLIDGMKFSALFIGFTKLQLVCDIFH
jgi:hypothetical protein